MCVVMYHHIRVDGHSVLTWTENDVQVLIYADRHDETDQNERPARQRGGKPVAVLDLPVLRRSNLLLRLIVVLARRGRGRLFVWLRLRGAPPPGSFVPLPHDPPMVLQNDTPRDGGEP